MKKAKTGRQRVQAYRVGDGWIGWVLCGVGKKQRLGKSSRGVMMRSTEYVCMYLYSFGIAILRTPTAPLSENERIDKKLVRVGRVGLFFNWITAPNRKWLRIANLISSYVCTCTITIQGFKYITIHRHVWALICRLHRLNEWFRLTRRSAANLSVILVSMQVGKSASRHVGTSARRVQMSPISHNYNFSRCHSFLEGQFTNTYGVVFSS